jgi:hypothetical protein
VKLDKNIYKLYLFIGFIIPVQDSSTSIGCNPLEIQKPIRSKKTNPIWEEKSVSRG